MIDVVKESLTKIPGGRAIRWLTERQIVIGQARPADYVMALTDASVNLPVVGKHLEPFSRC